MAPKKGGKPAKGKGGDDEGPDAKEMAGILEAKLMTLRQRIVYEQERSMKAMEKTEELTKNKTDMDDTSCDLKNKTRSQVSDMTKFYKQMEERQTEQIRQYEKTVEDQNKKKKELQDEIEQALRDKEKMIADKDKQIQELKEKISEMSSDFAQMLKDTLRKMHERVDFANQTWEGDDMVNALVNQMPN